MEKPKFRYPLVVRLDFIEQVHVQDQDGQNVLTMNRTGDYKADAELAELFAREIECAVVGRMNAGESVR